MKQITITALLVLASISMTFGQDQTTYDYVTIVTEMSKPRKVKVSSSDGSFKTISVESQEKSDYSGVLKVINSYEAQGYELYSNSFSTFGGNITASHNYFLLRKKKN